MRLVSPRSCRDVLAVMDDVEWMQSGVIGSRCTISYHTTRCALRMLERDGKVERSLPVGPTSMRLWRRVPAGYAAPLYEPQPGIDARPLAECLDGYTYRRVQHG